VAKGTKDGKQVTSGGRVLGVVKTASTLDEAVDKAYAKLGEVHFDNMYFRRDIGAKALAARR